MLVCIYVWMYICDVMYVCVHVMHACVFVHVWSQVCWHESMHVGMYVLYVCNAYIHACTHVYMHACTHVYMHAYMHERMQCMYACVHIFV